MLLEEAGTSGAPEPEHSHGINPVLRNVLLAIAVLYVLGSAYMLFDMNGRLTKAEQGLTAAETKQKDTEEELAGARANLKDSIKALGEKVGMTSEQLAKRSEELSRAEAQSARLAKQQQAQGQQLSQVSGDVTNVKTDLGGAKTDIANTKTDLEATKAKLATAMGDLNVQSGLIAHTQDDIEYLKHRGDRNIYEFTLSKGKRTPVSTVSLELKKSDSKKSKFTMNVMADDRTIEKKDRTAYEPMQFYTGRDHMLYEVVVMSVGKNTVSGYMSTPKNAPQPVQK